MSLESSLAALAAGSYQRETEHGADARSGAGGATIRAVSSESRPEPDTKGIQNWTASIPSSSSFSSISSSHASISASGSASGNNWAVLDEESDAEMFVDEGEGEGEGDETVLKLQDAVQV